MDRSDNGYPALIWATLLVQFALVSLSFPLAQLFTAAPLLHVDSPEHWYLIEAAKAFAATGNLSGYSPYFDAGYIIGVADNTSAKFTALFSMAISPWLNTAVSFKLFVFLASVFGPPCVPLAMRWWRLPFGAGVAATVLGLFVWWVSGLRWYHTVGMVTYVFASCMTLPYAALLTRYLTEPTGRLVPPALVVVGATAFFMHPLFPIPLGFLVMALFAAEWRNLLIGKMIFVCVALPILCVAANAFWILPTLSASYALIDKQPYQKFVDASILWQEALGMITAHARGGRVNTVLWLASLWCFAPFVVPRLKRLGIAIMAASFALMVFAALGAALPFVGTLQPNRLSTAAYLFLSVPAGIGVETVVTHLAARRIWRTGAAATTVVFLAAFVFLARELVREISPTEVAHHGVAPPEVRGLGANSQWVMQWLATATDSGARVLLQESPGPIYDYAHMAGYFAVASGREFLGGYPFKTRLQFRQDELLGRPVEAWSPQELPPVLERYNVGWVIASTDDAKRLLDRVPSLAPGPSHGEIKTYTVQGPHNFFLEGFGRVISRTFGRVELEGLAGPVIVLKYHYDRAVRSVPQAQIEPALVPGDPIPFVRIVDPPSRLTLLMP